MNSINSNMNMTADDNNTVGSGGGGSGVGGYGLGGGGAGGNTSSGALYDDAATLCASCDRCRSRKTKCDGKRPCGNCASKYMKKQKLNSIDGIDFAEFECVYSPAKRRGPAPGRTSGQARKASEMNLSQSASYINQQQLGGGQSINMSNAEWGPITSLGGGGGGAGTGSHSGLLNSSLAAALMSSAATSGGLNSSLVGAGSGTDSSTLQQQLSFLQQQLHQQQHHQLLPQKPLSSDGISNGSMHDGNNDEPSSRRIKMDIDMQQPSGGAGGIPRTITAHTHLLERNNQDGSRLLAYYRLSIDELFRLPPTPTDEEYCARLNIPGVTPRMIPGTHLAALSAARFAEVALGALVHNEVSLGMELCNAVVHCLRESVAEPVQPSISYEVAKAYFLLGVFRACRGDMTRYFKYRRVCMTYLTKLEGEEDKSAILLASISYLDSWAYMIYNANEKALPDIDDAIPAISSSSKTSFGSNATEVKYSVKTETWAIACNPINKNWIQGAPPVYLNNEAPLHARALDALACAVRTCCDQANGRFAAIAKEAEGDGPPTPIPEDTIITPTTTAVLSHENELCSRNMVLSAYTLMQQHESSNRGKHRNEGQHLVISAMDAFLENSDEAGSAGFTDSQIQSLLSVCNTAVENPFLLHHAGPTYHMVSNAAVLLCHLMNGMHAMKTNGQFGPMEATMFEEMMDTFISVRKLLVIHRRKLPVKLRCHGIPRPSLDGPKDGQPVVDLGETLLCACRGCQGFVLMACSPCVAAERARSASIRMEIEAAQEAEAVELGELDRELDDLGAELDMDDDALLNMISNLISN